MGHEEQGRRLAAGIGNGAGKGDEFGCRDVAQLCWGGLAEIPGQLHAKGLTSLRVGTVTPMLAPLKAIALANRLLARGETIRCDTDAAPADSPQW
jgi:hypothetical protein